MYSSIKVTTKYGEFVSHKCDYYIHGNILTVFRKEQIEEAYGRTYFPFESHYPMENVVEIECIKR